MNVHKNELLTPQGRALLVYGVRTEGWRVGDAAAAAGLSQRQAFRWLARHRTGVGQGRITITMADGSMCQRQLGNIQVEAMRGQSRMWLDTATTTRRTVAAPIVLSMPPPEPTQTPCVSHNAVKTPTVGLPLYRGDCSSPLTVAREPDRCG